jgi:uncharacterized protein (DUF1697 family)
MATSIVLLRGVNVGGNNRIAMADFKKVLTSLGATRADTYLQSGNAVVDLAAKGLAASVESALTEQLGLKVRAVVVSAAELKAIAAANPWPELVDRPKQLHVVFSDEQPDAALLNSLGLKQGGDELIIGKKCLYLAYGEQSHNSPLVPVLKKVNGVTTARNWTTVTALLDLTR